MTLIRPLQENSINEFLILSRKVSKEPRQLCARSGTAKQGRKFPFESPENAINFMSSNNRTRKKAGVWRER